MRAGRLIHRITIERYEQTGTDDFGTPILEWSTLHTLRAHVEQQSTEEFIRNIGASDELVVVFHTRFVEGIRTADRVVWREKAHAIREVAVQGRDEWLELRTVTLESP